MITCKHCGRVLSHPVYEFLGEGRICRETHGKAAQKETKNKSDDEKRNNSHDDNHSTDIHKFDVFSDVSKRKRFAKTLHESVTSD